MLGSCKKCSNCHSQSFRRIKNRAIQCKECKLILEERCLADLKEYHAVSQTEENHCVVTPDFMHKYIVDDIPNDPYCTPGFISAFRMLSPLREPVYTATSRTVSGSLAEMERVIGDALFAGYVGYNGRAPGAAASNAAPATSASSAAPVKDEPLTANDSSERNKHGGDARHTLVAYFEIVELASILFVDMETANLAVRIFRHTASNTSLRNRNVESLATAAFVAAVERRCAEYDEWLRTKKRRAAMKEENMEVEAVYADKSFAKNEGVKSVSKDSSQKEGDSSVEECSEWPVPPRSVTMDEVAVAANLEIGEVQRNLKVVNAALRKQRQEGSESIVTHMPAFCSQLGLSEHTKRLAMAIVEATVKRGICQRRNPVSVSAAAIYLACQLDGVRKTQTEICRVTGLTEVTLRKVHKELNQERANLIPEWFEKGGGIGIRGKHMGGEGRGAWSVGRNAGRGGRCVGGREVSEGGVGSRQNRGKSGGSSVVAMLEPPPLPPGLDVTGEESRTRRGVTGGSGGDVKAESKEGNGKTNVEGYEGGDEKNGLGVPCAEDGEADGKDDDASTDKKSAGPSTETTNAAARATASASALVAMMNTPTMRAIATMMSGAVPLMPPPPPPPPPIPPPPLPPPLPTGGGLENGGGDEKIKVGTGEGGAETKGVKNVRKAQGGKVGQESFNGGTKGRTDAAKGEDTVAKMQQSMMVMQKMVEAFQEVSRNSPDAVALMQAMMAGQMHGHGQSHSNGDANASSGAATKRQEEEAKGEGDGAAEGGKVGGSKVANGEGGGGEVSENGVVKGEKQS